MKIKIISYLIASIILFVTATELSANSDCGTLYFKMTISSIAKQNSIEQIFIGKPGIIDVYIDRSKDMFSIMYDAERLTDIDIYNMIQKAGYNIYFQSNPDISLSEASFKINSQDSLVINNIEKSLKEDKNIVDVYFDSSRNQLNIIFVSNIKDEKMIINALVKCGMKNPVIITNSGSKTKKSEEAPNSERNS
jgi:hypothetical protein